ncbi:MAG: hypothetical protein AB7P69_16710 [Candidatus Binatia bacterium]
MTSKGIALFASLAMFVMLPVSVSAPAQETRLQPEPLRNVLRWTTASEVDNFGFDVYRAEEESGPFFRITEQPVLGAGTSDEPARYEYIDAAIKPDTQYYYYVESISMSGVREKFTPTFKAPIKTSSSAHRLGEQ